jgi:hypothetical protein
MNTIKINLLACIVASSIFLLTTCKTKEKEGGPFEKVEVVFEKSGEVVINPGQGWILYEPYKGNTFNVLATNPSAANMNALRNSTSNGVKYGDVLDLASTGYSRYDWRAIQTGENTFNWSEIDRDIAKWAAIGKKYSFGIMSLSTHNNGTYTFTDASRIAGVSGAELNVRYSCPLPEWLILKGIKFTIENTESFSASSKVIVPVWDDPTYIAECKKFAEALANRYDGNTNIAFIDIRNYGNWGEMHMYPFFRNSWPEYKGHLTATQVQSLLLQPYINAFKKTQLVVCYGQPPLTGEQPSSSDLNSWAVKNGIGLRSDGVMRYDDDGGKYNDAYGKRLIPAVGIMPVVWEMVNFKEYFDPGEWDNAPARGKMTGDEAFLKAIRDNKPNYIGMGQFDNDAQYFFSKKSKLIREIANLMGFNFSMTTASYAKNIPAGEKQEISLSIENTGVNNMLTDCVVKLVLLDGDEKLVSSFTTDWDVKTIDGGTTEDFKANVAFAKASAGTYQLAIGLYHNENDQKPTYNLDNKGRTQDGFYSIGALTIEE